MVIETCRSDYLSDLNKILRFSHPVVPFLNLFIIDGGPGVHLRVDYHIFVPVVENVVVEHIIIASLFLKEVTVLIHVLIARVDPDEATPPLILQHRLFYHRVI